MRLGRVARRSSAGVPQLRARAFSIPLPFFAMSLMARNSSTRNSSGRRYRSSAITTWRTRSPVPIRLVTVSAARFGAGTSAMPPPLRHEWRPAPLGSISTLQWRRTSPSAASRSRGSESSCRTTASRPTPTCSCLTSRNQKKRPAHDDRRLFLADAQRTQGSYPARGDRLRLHCDSLSTSASENSSRRHSKRSVRMARFPPSSIAMVPAAHRSRSSNRARSSCILPRRAAVSCRGQRRERYGVIQWLMFQMGSVGPMLGQALHFNNYTPEPVSLWHCALYARGRAHLQRFGRAARPVGISSRQRLYHRRYLGVSVGHFLQAPGCQPGALRPFHALARRNQGTSCRETGSRGHEGAPAAA